MSHTVAAYQEVPEDDPLERRSSDPAASVDPGTPESSVHFTGRCGVPHGEA